ncbi:MAG: 3-carboxy-cis,cis-muconate cycloisomerase [Roseibium sp.]|nr:3-carboxy-cis,cis-muconate cycloisomerase [Roseibium sp.]
MPPAAFDSAIFGPLAADPATRELFSDAAVVQAMLDVEAALARAEADTGVISADTAQAIERASKAIQIDMDSLAARTLDDGVPVPALVAELRAQVAGDAASHVHYGATSQDILDTALMLRLKKVLDLHSTALLALGTSIADLARSHRLTPMAGRTRMQQAAPVSFGLKAGGWLSAVCRHLEQVNRLRQTCLCVSLSGATGNLAVLGVTGLDVERALAARLGLSVPLSPWHVYRDRLLELSGWWALVSGTLGKIGTDLVLLAQNEVGEVRLAGGSSSTLPNKANPVGAELLIALARHNAGLLGTAHQAALQEHERGGAGWTLEWLSLPQMAMTTGAALFHANRLFGGLEIDAARMRANLNVSNGLLLAEALGFELARHLPRESAPAVVKEACARVVRQKTSLTAATKDILREQNLDQVIADVDWERVTDPAQHLGASGALIDRILESFESLAGRF